MKFSKTLMLFLFILVCSTYFLIIYFPDFFLFKILKELPSFWKSAVHLVFLVLSLLTVFFPFSQYERNKNDMFWAFLTILALLMVLILGIHLIPSEFFNNVIEKIN